MTLSMFYMLMFCLAVPSFFIAAYDLYKTYPKKEADDTPIIKPGTRTTFNTFQ